MRVDLVFEGGGVLGIGFVGAYEAFYENKFQIIRAAGTSAGSVIAALICAGFTPQELREELENTDFTMFLKSPPFGNIPIIGKVLSLIFSKGLYDGNIISTWINSILKKKGIRVFGDLYINGECPLKVVAADITNRKLLILPDDIRFYGKDPKNLAICKAVQMSCTIPFFFTPVRILNDDYVSYIVDGGLISTFPIWIFEKTAKPLRPVIGVKIKDDESFTKQGKNNVLSYAYDLITAAINKDELTYVSSKDLVRIITIDNPDHLKSTDFKLSKKQIENLYYSGYLATNKYLAEFRLNKYIKEFML